MIFACAALLTAAILLGGGTRAGFLSDVILQMLALPVAAIIALSWRRNSLGSMPARHALGLAAGLVLLPLIQIVPLPVGLVQAMSRDHLRWEVWAALGQLPTWTTISVSADATLLSALSLLPPVVLFLGVLRLNQHERRSLSGLVVVLAVFSALLGLMQLASGPTSWLRPYAFTNHDDAVGFFANRNHLASLLVVGAIYALAWLDFRESKARRGQASVQIGPVAMPAVMLSGAVIAIVFVLLVATFATRSRGGILLMVLSLGLAALMLRPLMGTVLSKARWPIVLGIGLLVALAIGEVTGYRFVGRFGGDVMADGRITIARAMFAAIGRHLPLGSGMGTFSSVFPAYYDVRSENPGYFVNRAHNDALEFVLEAGVLGVALMVGFLIWFGACVAAIVRPEQPSAAKSGASRLDLALIRAALLVVLVLLVHSLIDYPLRTSALACCFAMACALLVPPEMVRSARDEPPSPQR